MRGAWEKHLERMEAEEFWASAFMGAGCLIWAGIAGAALLTGSVEAFYGFGACAVLCAVIFAAGINHQRVAIAALMTALVALVMWGASMQWELGIWLIIGASLVIPLNLAAILYYEARREISFMEHVNPVSGRGAHA